ncbi:MAG TPA: S9 family peptidase [Candidatus Krumholzibacteria bacterium]|nr:S9 family peptidase [Candidatus Krumholzibacteria bacterium]
MNPPIAKKIPKNVTVHEDPRVDEYHWLRERDNPDVVAYLRAENEYADAMLAPTDRLQRLLYDEMLARLNETDSSVPVQRDEYFYYTRTEKDRQYEIFCRRRATDAIETDAPEEVLLDENALAHGRPYFAVGAREVSPDHRYLAYTVDTTGSESFELFVMDLATRAVVDGPIPGLSYDVEWGNDSHTLFYTILDVQMRPHAVRRHRLGAPAVSDVELYRESDPAFFVGVEVSRSREYLFIVMESNTTTEMHVARSADAVSDAGPSAFRVVQPRRTEVEYHIAHSGESFFILTNEDAFNFRVFEAPARDPSRAQWREIIAHRPSVKIDAVEAFERHLVVVERENGLKRIRVIDLLTRESREVALDEPVYTVWLEQNPEFHATTLRFSYSSLTTPRSVFDYDMAEGTLVLRKRYDVLGGFDPARYASERLYASAVDGTRVPISLVYRRDTPRDGSAPVLLYGYGAYGVSVEPHFVSNRVSLLDRGVIFAIAHVRGGGELGRAWYEKGKRFYKRNTFTDFIACAEHLIAKGYTRAGGIVCYGGSAGGMLMGAVANLRPDLWRAMVAVVPFVDVLNTMLDHSLPLTVIEFEEWGNPEEKKAYEYIRSYSPYENIQRQDYPAMLVLSGFNDRRVQYWEPAKWVAKLRATKTDANPLLLRTRMGEGHKGASGRYDYLKDVALEYAFILERVGREG